MLYHYDMDPSIEHLKASDGSANASLATVQSTRSGGASTISVDTVSGIPDFFCASMGTPHTFTDPITSETITVIDESTAVDFAGHVDGTNLEIDDIAPGYTDGGSEVGDIIIIRPTTQYADNLAAILGVAHRNDGELNATVIYDANDNEVAEFESVTSAVNNIGFVNAATGNPAIIKAKGGDTNIGIELTPKGTGEVTINGNPIQAEAVAFLVRRTTSQTISTSTVTKIQFATEVYDEGSDYDSSTNYQFTAPYDGIYHFNANTQLDAMGSESYIYLYVDNALYLGGHGVWTSVATDDEFTSISADVKLTAGQVVDVRLWHNAGANRTLLGDSSYRVWFSGHLIART